MLDIARDAAERSLKERSPSELIAIGRAKYESDVLPNIPRAKEGMMVVMDIASGDYEIDFHAPEARTRLKRRRPDAVTHLERVGSPTPYQAVSVRSPADD